MTSRGALAAPLAACFRWPPCCSLVLLLTLGAPLYASLVPANYVLLLPEDEKPGKGAARRQSSKAPPADSAAANGPALSS